MTPNAAMHYLAVILTLCRATPSVERKVKHPRYELILATMRQKSVLDFEKMR
jgi:hypothetical protein